MSDKPVIYASKVKPPLIPRMLNRVMTLVKPKKPYHAENLISQARQTAGLDDLGSEDGWREGLEALVDAWNREAEPGYIGAAAFGSFCRRALTRRLQVVDYLKNNPEILEQPIVGPVLVTGLPRTGTTLLHSLLSQHPQAHCMRYWEQASPTPAPHPDTRDTDPRLEKTRKGLAQFHKLFPGFSAVHHLEADAPEECNGLFDASFCSIIPAFAFRIPSYLDWLETHDATHAYTFYKQQLQILSHHFPGKRWVMKAPMHLCFPKALFGVFPDARVLLTHRDPLKAVPSAAGLAYLHYLSNNFKADTTHSGEQTLKRWAKWRMRALKWRAEHPELSVTDVDFSEMMKDPIVLAMGLLKEAGFEMNADVESLLKQWLNQNQQHKHGVYRYSPQEYGLSDEAISAAFQ